MNKQNKDEEFKGFDENSRIVINDNESGQTNNNNNNHSSNNNPLTGIQNYLLSLTDRLQINSNIIFFVFINLWV